MADDRNLSNVSETEAREVAEESRQETWEGKALMRELFLGRLRMDWIHPFPEPDFSRPEFVEFYKRLHDFLENTVDPVAIDEQGEYPDEVMKGLVEMGAMGMKIGAEYGGLGFSQSEYCKALELVGRYDANLVALLSAHQSIGVPQPLKLFGTEEQKKKYLPWCVKAPSAFALTETQVGSDPARLATTARKSEDGKHYILNGEKLWITNGTFADLMVVMARDPDSRKISAFIVEAGWEGVEIGYRCRFMGLRAIENGVIHFKDVKVPAENLVGKEGQGLKIALITLNTGRLSLPAATVGTVKEMVHLCRQWSNERVQWGVPIGKHEAVAKKLAWMSSTTYAMESVSYLANELSMRAGYDIRLEASLAKEWNSTRQWRIIDEALQVRGGRGYETERSLRERGERPTPVERAMRDSRINLIFEGSSEVMHLFMAREAVDKHLQIAGDLIDPKKGMGAKLAALVRAGIFYAWWYPTRWLGWSLWPRYSGFGKLGKHLRFADRAARRLARNIFHGMVFHGPKLEKRQGFLFRAVDIAMELTAIAAVCARAQHARRTGQPDAEEAVQLADVFSRGARRRIKQWFRELWRNDDAAEVGLADEMLAGRNVRAEQDHVINLSTDEGAFLKEHQGGDAGRAA